MHYSGPCLPRGVLEDRDSLPLTIPPLWSASSDILHVSLMQLFYHLLIIFFFYIWAQPLSVLPGWMHGSITSETRNHTHQMAHLHKDMPHPRWSWGTARCDHHLRELRHYHEVDNDGPAKLIPSTIGLYLNGNASISFSHHVLLSFWLRSVCRILDSKLPPSNSRYARCGRTHNLRSLSLMRSGPMHLDQVDVPPS